ncbi:hypothetical protein [Streptomyces sp. NPDC092370]|uniref:hypothetical protein n=1 Tax=Streptomyces sp. NPDC092370 TaxID=3366016 RepID=UPI00382E79EA
MDAVEEVAHLVAVAYRDSARPCGTVSAVADREPDSKTVELAASPLFSARPTPQGTTHSPSHLIKGNDASNDGNCVAFAQNLSETSHISIKVCQYAGDAVKSCAYPRIR